MNASASSSPRLAGTGSPAAAARSATPARDLWRYVFLIGGLGNVANGLWMLADPAGWYAGVPAAVPDFGPLNEHFVRDIGSTFTMLGLALLWAASVPAFRVPMLGVVALFYVLHALVHVYDTARGLVGPAHWAIDFPAVYLPAILLVGMLAALARSEQAEPR